MRLFMMVISLIVIGGVVVVNTVLGLSGLFF
jgi:hypothetical protein